MEKRIISISAVVVLLSVWFISFYLNRYDSSLIEKTAPIKKAAPLLPVPEDLVVRIRNLSCQSLEIGSGFFIEENTIVTNRHVVSPSRKIEAITRGGQRLRVKKVSISAVKDLAFIEVAAKSRFIQPGIEPSRGSVVSIPGYPKGGEIETVKGPVAGYIKNRPGLFLVKAKIKPGNSGGPVIEKGRVVGVVFKSAGPLALAISINEITRSKRSRLFTVAKCQ